MRRVVVLVGLVGAALLSQGVMWFGCPREVPKVATIERVKDNLYVVRGGGGNTGVLVTSAGVVLVDTKLAGWGATLLEQVRTVTDKPIVTIINTHTHGDHIGNNEFFPNVVDIVAQEKTKAHMLAMGIFQGGRSRFAPTRAFADRMSFTRGADRIDLYYFGAGHTDGDAVVVFPALRTAHIGDLFAGKSLPVIDAVNGGSGVAYPDTLEKAYAGITDVDTIITGHSTLMTWDDLKEYAGFNRDFLEWTKDQLKTGRNEEDAAAAYRIPAKYKGYPSQPWVAKANIETTYRELKPATHATRWWGGVR